MNLSYSEVRAKCLKSDEADKPWYPRHVTHALSTRLIWLLQDWKLSPNTITLLSIVSALASVPFLAELTARSVLTGALLVELYYVLDAVDGQWARFKKMKSLTGAFFDVLVNYVIQPPIVFALGWGVYHRTGDEQYLLLGFLGAFSTLWMILMWTVRNSVLLGWLSAAGKSPARPAAAEVSKGRPSIPRQAFSWIHKSLVFPWFMYGLTLSAILSFVMEAVLLNEGFTARWFEAYLLYYGVIGPLVATMMTAYWIFNRSLEKSPELGPH